MIGSTSLARPHAARGPTWSAAGAYCRTALTMFVIFAWAPVWIAMGGQRSLLSFAGQVQFSGLLVFATTPLGAVPVAWHLRRGQDGPIGMPLVFVALKVALVLVTAALFYVVSSAAPPGRLSPSDAALSRTLAFLMVGIPLSVPFGIVYGAAFRTLIGLWPGQAAEADAGR